MSHKWSVLSKVSDSKPKRQRKIFTMEEKVKRFDMLKEGRCADVDHYYGINESTVCYIKKDKKIVVPSRNKAIVRMESALAFWIRYFRKTNIALDTNVSRKKARQLCGKFTNGRNDDPNDPEPGLSPASATKPTEFNINKGWFDKFQRRFNLKSMSLYGESASVDKPAAVEYVTETFKTIVEEGGYSREKVFKMDETCFFWELMPLWTLIFKEEATTFGFKVYGHNYVWKCCRLYDKARA